MKKFLHLLLALCLVCGAAFGQQNIVLQPTNDQAQWGGLTYGSAGNYASVANTFTTVPPVALGAIELIRYTNTGNLALPITLYTDFNGNSLRVRDIQLAPANAATQMPSGFYIIGERTNGQSGSILVMRVNNLGAVQWSRVHSTSSTVSAKEVGTAGQVMPNGDLIIIGERLASGSANTSGYAARFTPNGILVWGNRYIGSNCQATAFSLKPVEMCLDNTTNTDSINGLGVAITGITKVGNPATGGLGQEVPFILALNSNGTVRFYFTYGTTTNADLTSEQGLDITQTPSTLEFAVAGRVTLGSASQRILAFGTDQNGILSWKKVLNVPSTTGTVANAYARAIYPSALNTGSYILAGPDVSANQTFALSTLGNSTGGSTWAFRYTDTGAHPNAAECLTSNNSGGYLLTTNTPIPTGGTRDAVIEILGTNGMAGNCPATTIAVSAFAIDDMQDAPYCVIADEIWTDYSPLVNNIDASENYCGATPPCQLNVVMDVSQQSICVGESAVLFASVFSEPCTFSWSNGGVGSPLTVFPSLGTTTYCVTATSIANPNCTASACITVTAENCCDLQLVTDVSQTTICVGTPAVLYANVFSEPCTFLWSDGSVGAPVTVFPPLGVTTYCVTATSIANPNCTTSSCFTVTVIDCCQNSVSIVASKPKICVGESSTLTATAGVPSTFLWSNGAVGSAISVSPIVTTTYCVTATSIANTNCTATSCITVFVLPCLPPTAVTVTARKCTSFKVSWTPGQCIKKSRVQYRKCGTSTWTFSPWTTGTNRVLTGLTCGTCYQFRLQSQCLSGAIVYTAFQTTNTVSCNNIACQIINPNDPTDNPTGLVQNETGATTILGGEILVFPNPTRDMIEVDLTSIAGQDITLTLFNTNGARVQTLRTQSGSITSLDLSHLPTGMYLLRIAGNDVQQTLRVIKE